MSFCLTQELVGLSCLSGHLVGKGFGCQRTPAAVRIITKVQQCSVPLISGCQIGRWITISQSRKLNSKLLTAGQSSVELAPPTSLHLSISRHTLRQRLDTFSVTCALFGASPGSNKCSFLKTRGVYVVVHLKGQIIVFLRSHSSEFVSETRGYVWCECHLSGGSWCCH